MEDITVCSVDTHEPLSEHILTVSSGTPGVSAMIEAGTGPPIRVSSTTPANGEILCCLHSSTHMHVKNYYFMHIALILHGIEIIHY